VQNIPLAPPVQNIPLGHDDLAYTRAVAMDQAAHAHHLMRIAM
jgi:hypothetical protein